MQLPVGQLGWWPIGQTKPAVSRAAACNREQRMQQEQEASGLANVLFSSTPISKKLLQYLSH